MSTDPDTILLETEEHMEKAVEHLQHELRGLRTGRASTALVDYVKVDYYGSMTELKSLAAISVPEPTQLLIKPFDAGSIGAIKQALEGAGLGFNPIVEAKQIRINVPALSRDRRFQLVTHAKKAGEAQKVIVRNARRDANKHADTLGKQPGTHYPEDEIDRLKEEIQSLLKKYETKIDDLIAHKTKEIEEV